MERNTPIEHPFSLVTKLLSEQLPSVRYHTVFKTGTFPFWQSGVVGDTDPLPKNAHSVVTVSQGELLKDEEDGYYVHDHRGSYIIDGMPAAWIPKSIK